jgi:hypothetical protein
MKTKSEELFEIFLKANSLPFEKIEEATSRRPDYLIFVGDLKNRVRSKGTGRR